MPMRKAACVFTRLFEANETGAIYFESYMSSDFRFNLSASLFDLFDAKCDLFFYWYFIEKLFLSGVISFVNIRSFSVNTFLFSRAF